jgi:ABC-type polysaccharide/polyol phosphate export permease
MKSALEWYPVFLREMLLYKRRLLRLGYLISTMVVPIVYLIAFGFGLGGSVQLQGTTYLDFLIPGLVAMSSMINSYTWVANSLNLDRLYFKTFQVFIQSPIRPVSILVGEVFASVVKGLLTSVLIIVAGLITSRGFSITPIFLLALLLNCFLFANLGVITGMLSRSHEDIGTYSNFFILPMAFFGGTFFPLDKAPLLLKSIIYLLPLTHTNILMRKTAFDAEALISFLVLIAYAALFLIYGSRIIRRYSE